MVRTLRVCDPVGRTFNICHLHVLVAVTQVISLEHVSMVVGTTKIEAWVRIGVLILHALVDVLLSERMDVSLRGKEGVKSLITELSLVSLVVNGIPYVVSDH